MIKEGDLVRVARVLPVKEVFPEDMHPEFQEILDLSRQAAMGKIVQVSDTSSSLRINVKIPKDKGNFTGTIFHYSELELVFEK